MPKFFQFVFASCLGFIIGSLLLIFVGSAIIGGIAAMAAGGNKPVMTANTILELKLSEVLPERTNNAVADFNEVSTGDILGLHDILYAIENAKSDSNIKGIFMDFSSVNLPRVKSALIRESLKDFKTSGKFVKAYADYYTQNAYYMASVADEVIVNPIGTVDFKGFASIIPFYKDMLDRLGIKMNIYYVGDFKSATEPLRRTEMSDSSKLQVREYLSAQYDMFLTDIAVSRNTTPQELKKIAEGYLVRKAEDAKSYGLVDRVGYRDEAYDAMRDQLGFEKDEKLKIKPIKKYFSSLDGKDLGSGSSRIAVVYAEGSIVSTDEEQPGQIDGEQYASILRKLRQKDNVKAIVLRVNSPGGSALASEAIWREVSLCKQEGKPVIASMGDYAASGGYYISCAADSIYTAPGTLTGSIGVFGVIPNIGGALRDKVGIQFDSVKTATYATGVTTVFDGDEKLHNIIQESVERTYDIFLDRVAEGRKMSLDEVKRIAKGRVWTGRKAVELGLADAEGDLEDAIATAARMSGLENYRLTEYPKTKNPLEQLLSDILKQDMQSSNRLMKNTLGDLYPYYEQLKTIHQIREPQARLPFELEMALMR